MLVATETAPELQDFFIHDVPLPMRAKFFPLGFPLELATNSEAVMVAARQSWGMFREAYPEAPLSICMTVTDDPGRALPPRPLLRWHQHIMTIVSDAHNQAICDFNGNCAFGWVTSRVAGNALFLRLRFLESAVMSLLVQAYLAPVHSGLVTRNGVGVAHRAHMEAPELDFADSAGFQ